MQFIGQTYLKGIKEGIIVGRIDRIMIIQDPAGKEGEDLFKEFIGRGRMTKCIELLKIRVLFVVD